MSVVQRSNKQRNHCPEREGSQEPNIALAHAEKECKTVYPTIDLPTLTKELETCRCKASSYSPSEQACPDAPPPRSKPLHYETCPTRDLVISISSMIAKLVRYNDAMSSSGYLVTRFHSRTPQSISIHDYLQRLTTYTKLSQSALLSMACYADRICAFYPGFAVTSLTVHRFLIASAIVASKVLNDASPQNKIFAEVGGVSTKELAILELEFLTKMEWRVVLNAELLNDCYQSLIEGNP